MASTLYGRQQPTARVCPEYAETHGPRVYKLMQKAGFDLMPWQRGLLDDWMGRKPSGEWSASTAGGSVPRQNGKTRDVAARCAGGMMLYGEWIVYTSHLQKTSTETFEEVRSIFETPALKKYVKDIKAALGREEITLTNGGRIKFLARTRNGGRGQHGDLWICDEAQELTDEQQGSFLPILAASKNPQTIYIGTPPDESAPGEVFTRIRSEALAGKTTKTAWSEWSVTDIGDTADRERWAECNPSLGYMIKESTIEAEHEQMAPDKFARERLGWWSTKSAKAVIDADAWDACATEDPPEDGIKVLAVKCSPDNAEVTVSICVKPKDGVPHVEIICTQQTSDGLTSVVDSLMAAKDSTAQLVIDGQGTAQAMNDSLVKRGYPKRAIIRPKAADMASACSTLLNAVNERQVTHYAQEDLDAAAKSCSKRVIGSAGGWGFDGEGATLIEAAALAYWGAVNTKRDPNRKQRML